MKKISLVRIRKFVRDSEGIAPPLIVFPIRSPLSRLKSINVEFQFNKMMFGDDNRIKECKVNNLSSLKTLSIINMFISER